jgi:hypothetical protein
MTVMAYDASNIIVGAAAIFLGNTSDSVPVPSDGESYADTVDGATGWANVGYTSNGLEVQFAPEFGEVQVDQVLDVAKMFKSGMTVTLNTSFAEATLENLAIAIAQPAPTTTGNVLDKDDDTGTSPWGASGVKILDIKAGELGECPVERKLIAVGAGGGDCGPTDKTERIYTAYRVLSIDSVTASQKRDEASVFDVSFRLLPDSNGRYGQIVDRTYTPA